MLLKADQCIFFVHVYRQGGGSGSTQQEPLPVRSWQPLCIKDAVSPVDAGDTQKSGAKGREGSMRVATAMMEFASI
jgi:hypothetical protein